MLSLLKCATPCNPRSPLLPPAVINHSHLQTQSNVNVPPDVKKLKLIHHQVTHLTTRSSLLLFNGCLQFYVNLGLMQEAQKLFDEMPERTLISWTILMSGYTRHGPVTETLALFEKMMKDDTNVSIQPDSFVYAIVLRACAAIGNVYYGRGIHCRILKTIALIDSFVENALVSMYASCGYILDSIRVFDGIMRPNLVSWSSMLSGYVQNGLEEEGLRLFVKMVEAGIEPDVFALSMFIGASANLGRLGPGIQVHCSWIKMTSDYCLFLENCLIDFYARCGDPGSSEKVFNQMSRKNLVSYNAIVNGYVRNCLYVEALSVFRALMNEDFNLDEFTLAGVLQAVIGLGALDHGREIHGYIIKVGLESSHYVSSSLLEMYIECTDHESSTLLDLFPPKIFSGMEGGESNKFIIASILKWCSLHLDLQSGKLFHTWIIKNDLQADAYVVSSLMDMYSKCGFPEAAFMVFSRVKDKGVVPWSVIIAGYCWNGWFDQALKLFQRMQFNFVEANEYSYTSILLACVALGNFRKIKELHCRILRTGYESNTSVMNTLIYVYSEFLHHRQALALCSFVPEAEILWVSLIQSCERVGEQEIILKLVHEIQKTNGKLDTTCVCSILDSCAKLALLIVGTQVQAYLIKRGLISEPSANNSLINMYSKCGMICEALSAFNYMHKKNSDSYTLIISAYVEHGHPAEAMTLFSQVRRGNKSMNSTTLTSIFKACAQMGLVQEALRLFISMDKVYGIEPSMEHYTCVVEVLGRAGMFEDAQEFINGVIQFKPVPTLIWRALLLTSRVHGNMKVAKYAAQKILLLDPNDLGTAVLLEQVLLTEGKWSKALNLKRNKESLSVSSSWIEIRNRVYMFASNESATEEIYDKLLEIEHEMEELGYVGERHHSLHNAEEILSCEVGYYHTEMKALAFGLLMLLPGKPIRVLKSIRMCGECHSAFKFMSTFLGRELIVKDSCNFHHFINGKCSCKDAW